MDNENPPRSRDGNINFTGYTNEQLMELESSIDPERFPLNHARLVEEMKRREAQAVPSPIVENAWDIRYSSSESLLGWMGAKRLRQWFHGRGSLEIQSEQIALRGWQRNWLGARIQGERHIALASIRNVGRDGKTVMIEYRDRANFTRKLEIDCESAEAAQLLRSRLPSGRRSSFDREYQDLRAFQRLIYSPSNYPWAATALVGLNVLAFVAFIVATKSWFDVQPQMLAVWGSNYGPFTIGGQWWRLLSSLFLHLGLLHLILNMWVLWNVGRLTERILGHSVFLALYFFTGIISGLTTLAWNPAINVLGSSGAIFGIMGALLTSIVHRRHSIPPAFVKPHWIGLLVFTIFNLAAGFMQFGVANAAHVGGIVAGALVGSVIGVPRFDSKQRYRFKHIVAAIGAGVTVLLVTLALTPGIGSPSSPAQNYWKSHQWFVSGEANNMRQWQSLMMRAQAGTISNDALARAVTTKIRPFWQSAVERTLPSSSPVEQRYVAQDLNAYAMARLDWTTAIIDAINSGTLGTDSNVQFYLQKIDTSAAHLERRSVEDNANLVSRALVRSVLVTRARRLFFPASPCVRSADKRFVTNSKDLDSDGPKRRDSIACAAQTAFRTGDFKRLEELFTQYPATYADPADGGSDRYAILKGLDDMFESGGMTQEDILVGITGWRHAYSHSSLPDVVEAAAFSDLGWLVRGHGYAAATSQQQMQLFAHRIAMADGVLQDIKLRSENEPLWHTLAIQVKLDLGEPRGEIRSSFDEAVEKFPNFLPLYSSAIRSLMPRWGGTFERVNDLILDATYKRYPKVDAEIYARLYWTYAQLEGDDVDIFTDAQADWARMNDGFDLLIKRYPDSDYILNGYAYMACRAGDSAKYHELKAKLLNRMSSTAWSDRYSPSECDKKYAAEKSTVPVEN